MSRTLETPPKNQRREREGLAGSGGSRVPGRIPSGVPAKTSLTTLRGGEEQPLAKDPSPGPRALRLRAFRRNQRLPADRARFRLPVPQTIGRGPRRWVALFLLGLSFTPALGQRVVPVAPPTSPLQRRAFAVRALRTDARVLYVTAHPDDEDNATLAWMTLGRGADVTLLTLTRGEGGQNRIGDELFEPLAVLRMGELGAARRFDGARQRLGPFIDFGYSFSEEETFEKWGREAALRHIVGTIRELEPQLLLTMPARWPGGGRHHQASAQLAQEAFKVAATERWPELGTPHAVDRLFEQVWIVAGQDARRLYEVPVDQHDAIAGASYRELGFRARAQHKCQSMPQVWPPQRPRRRNIWKLLDCRSEVPSPRPRANMLWGLEAKTPELDEAAPEERLFAIAKSELARAESPSRRRKWSRLLWHASGLEILPRASTAQATPGESLSLRIHVRHRGDRPRQLRLKVQGLEPSDPITVFNGTVTHPGKVIDAEVPLPSASIGPLVALVPDTGFDRFHQSGPLPSASAISVVAELRDADTRLLATHRTAAVHRSEGPHFPVEEESGVAVLPQVSATLEPAVVITPASSEAPVKIALTLQRRAAVTGRVEAVLTATGDVPGSRPRGTVIDRFDVGPDAPRTIQRTLSLTPRSERDSVWLRWVLPDGRESPLLRIREVSYPHIDRYFLSNVARADIVRIPVTFDRSARVGYVEGRGDRVSASLEALLSTVTIIAPQDLARGFADYDVIALGIRALQRPEVKRALPALLAWVEQGGHLVLQYQRPDDLREGSESVTFAPARARVTRRRITVEETPVKVLQPSHRFFRHPNRITAADFEGWVQERGVYFLEPQAEGFRSLLEMTDPWPANSEPQRGALVTYRHGKGTWTYTGLALFRQLPRGVPGAWRLFANLIALPR